MRKWASSRVPSRVPRGMLRPALRAASYSRSKLTRRRSASGVAWSALLKHPAPSHPRTRARGLRTELHCPPRTHYARSPGERACTPALQQRAYFSTPTRLSAGALSASRLSASRGGPSADDLRRGGVPSAGACPTGVPPGRLWTMSRTKGIWRSTATHMMPHLCSTRVNQRCARMDGAAVRHGAERGALRASRCGWNAGEGACPPLERPKPGEGLGRG